MNQPRLMLSCFVLLGLSACNIYSRRQGEFIAGPVDPTNFPPENLGNSPTTTAGIDRTRQGSGTFIAIGAFTGNQPIEYFRFSFTTSQSTGTPANDLRVRVAGNANARVPTPAAYVFNPGPTSPTTPACSAPQDYSYNPDEGDIPYNEQGPIFLSLPTATYSPGVPVSSTYVPIVAEVGVTVNGTPPCQDVKSESTLLSRSEFSFPRTDLPLGKQTGTPDGRYLAWAVIDPGSPVYHFRPTGPLGNVNFATGAGLSRSDPASGLGIQRWGWFNHYILAFLDGGYIPTTAAADGTVTMRTQRLYYPRSTVNEGTVANPRIVAGTPGRGYDVLQYARSNPNYSPVCQVFSYNFTADVLPNALPRTSTIIEALPGGAIQPGTPPFMYCLQVQ